MKATTDAAGIKAVLFDFGGVLAELRGETHLLGLLHPRMTKAQMWAAWSASPAVRAHETGNISADEFSRRIVEELTLSIAPGEFLDGFREWIVGPFAGTHALIRDVAARHTTALVTNTSALHHVFASYQIGCIKPDREYFEFVLAQMGLLPGEAVFLDDSAINVAAARELGIHARRVEGAAQARRELAMLDIL